MLLADDGTMLARGTPTGSLPLYNERKANLGLGRIVVPEHFKIQEPNILVNLL